MALPSTGPVECPPQSCKDCRLRATGMFTPVTPAQLTFIQALRTSIGSVGAGAKIIEEGRPSRELYTLYSGWAFRYKTLADGRRQILNFLLPGDLIGLQQQFSGESVHGVEAVTACSLCVFPRDGLWELYRDHPELGYDLTWLAAHEEGLVDDNLLSVGRRTATERIAMLLVHLYRRAERLGLTRGGAIDFPFNQQHIADALGLSLVHTNKTLRRLQRLGLHRMEDGRLWLVDVKALQRTADYFTDPERRVPLL